MPNVISRTEHADSREVEYLYDNGTRVIHDERTGAWTVWRIPSITDILAAAKGNGDAQSNILDITEPVRYTPPVLADAPRHTAEVGAGDDD